MIIVVDYYMLSVVVFVAALAVLIYVDRAKVEHKYGIFFMRRTTRGKSFIDKIARANPNFWRIMGDLGILTGFIGMIGGTYLIAQQALTPKAGPGLAFLIPLPSAQVAAGFGYIGIPFWFFIIGIAAMVVIHEGFHGIQVRREGIKIKTLGLLLLAIIPGAFVEPDEKALRKKSWLSQMRVYAAGSFGNFVLAGVTVLLTTFLLSPVLTTGAITFAGYVDPALHDHAEPYPAQLAEITPPLLSLDGQRVESAQEFAQILAAKSPGDVVRVETLQGTYDIKLEPHPEDPSRSFLGVAGVQDTYILKDRYRNDPVQAGVIGFVLDALTWIVILNFGIGIVNLLPVWFLDGGLMMKATAQKFFPKNAEDIVNGAGGFVLVLILWNFVGPAIV